MQKLLRALLLCEPTQWSICCCSAKSQMLTCHKYDMTPSSEQLCASSSSGHDLAAILMGIMKLYGQSRNFFLLVGENSEIKANTSSWREQRSARTPQLLLLTLGGVCVVVTPSSSCHLGETDNKLWISHKRRGCCCLSKLIKAFGHSRAPHRIVACNIAAACEFHDRHLIRLHDVVVEVEL